jgi:hypothetical protein
MRTAALVLFVLACAAPAQAEQSVQVAGKLGYLSEWEVSGKVAQTGPAGRKEFAGPLVVRHVGVCTPGHPVEMAGEIRYRITGWMTPRMHATLVIDGIECGFEARLSGAYEGAISCEAWRGVPLSLSLKPAE